MNETFDQVGQNGAPGNTQGFFLPLPARNRLFFVWGMVPVPVLLGIRSSRAGEGWRCGSRLASEGRADTQADMTGTPGGWKRGTNTEQDISRSCMTVSLLWDDCPLSHPLSPFIHTITITITRAAVTALERGGAFLLCKFVQHVLCNADNRALFYKPHTGFAPMMSFVGTPCAASVWHAAEVWRNLRCSGVRAGFSRLENLKLPNRASRLQDLSFISEG